MFSSPRRDARKRRGTRRDHAHGARAPCARIRSVRPGCRRRRRRSGRGLDPPSRRARAPAGSRGRRRRPFPAANRRRHRSARRRLRDVRSSALRRAGAMSALNTSVDDRRAGRVSTRAVVASYVVAFIAAELLTAFVAPAAGAATDVAIPVFAIHHHGAPRTPSGSDVGGRPSLSAFLLCLPVLCVARIAPFALPVAGGGGGWPALRA